MLNERKLFKLQARIYSPQIIRIRLFYAEWNASYLNCSTLYSTQIIRNHLFYTKWYTMQGLLLFIYITYDERLVGYVYSIHSMLKLSLLLVNIFYEVRECVSHTLAIFPEINSIHERIISSDFISS